MTQQAERIPLREAAQLAGVHRNTVRNWVRAGKLTTAALEARDDGGEEWRVDRAELERLDLLQPAEPEAEPEADVAGGEPAHPPVPEHMQMIPTETLERLVAIAASYAEAGERIGRAEAERDVYRERLDDARGEAEQLRAELDALRTPSPAEDRADPDPTSPPVADRVRSWWARLGGRDTRSG